MDEEKETLEISEMSSPCKTLELEVPLGLLKRLDRARERTGLSQREHMRFALLSFVEGYETDHSVQRLPLEAKTTN